MSCLTKLDSDSSIATLKHLEDGWLAARTELAEDSETVYVAEDQHMGLGCGLFDGLSSQMPCGLSAMSCSTFIMKQFTSVHVMLHVFSQTRHLVFALRR